MNKYFLKILAIFLSCLISGCSESSDQSDISSHTASIRLIHSFPIGMWPNALYHDGRDIYIVDSGNNEIDLYHIDSNTYEDSKIKLPVDSNPVQVSADEGNVYIITAKSNKLYQYSKTLQTLSVILDHDLNMPYSIVSSNGCHTIVNSEYNYDTNSADGSITHICGNFIQNLKTPCKNPIAIQSINDKFLLTCSGVYQYDSSFQVIGTVGSAMILTDIDYHTIRSVFADDDPGTVAISDKYIVSGTAYKGIIHLLDHELNILDTYSFNTDNSNMMLVPRHISKNLFVIADFNHDKLFFVQINNGMFEWVSENAISDSPVARKGPLDIVYDETSHHLIILNSLSETLDIYQY